MEDKKSRIRSIDTITITDLLRAAFKYMYIIIAGVVIGAVIGLIFFMREYNTPRVESYSAEASMSIITATTDGVLIDDASELERSISDITSASSLSTNVTALAQSNYITNKVIEKIGDESISPARLKSAITVAPIEKTMFLTVSIKWPDRDQSIALVNAMMEVLPVAMDEKLGLGSVLVVDYATDASLSISPHNYSPTYISLLIGLVIGVLTAFLLYILNLRVNTSDEITEFLSLNTLAEIPYYRSRSGYKLLTDEDISVDYREANAVLASVFSYLCAKEKYKVIYVTSAVSGEGKTTVSINLSVSLSDKNKKVLLIDFDIKRPVISELLETGAEKPSFADVLGGVEYTEALYNIRENLDFIRADYADLMPDSEMVKAKLDSLRNCYDYIIIDTPPIGLVADAFNLNGCVDGMIYIIRQDYASFSVIADSINSIRDAGANIIGAVLNARHSRNPAKYYSKNKYYSNYYGSYSGDHYGSGKSGYGEKYGKYYRRDKYYRRGKKDEAKDKTALTSDEIVARIVAEDAAAPVETPTATYTDETVEPVVEAAEPVVEAPEPVVEEAEPVVEETEPIVEETEPVVEAAEPVVEAAEPIVEAAVPVVEEAAEPIVEEAEPVVEAVEPVVEEAAEPIVEAAVPVVEEAAEPIVEEAEPVVEATEPVVEAAEPVFEAAVPVVEEAKPVIEAAVEPVKRENTPSRKRAALKSPDKSAKSSKSHSSVKAAPKPPATAVKVEIVEPDELDKMLFHSADSNDSTK